MKKQLSLALMLAASLGYSTQGLALEKGDWILHLRAINISPNDDSSEIKVGGAGVAGTGVEVDDATTLDISIGYMITDNLNVEILLDPSSEHNVSTTGLANVDGVPSVPDGTDVVSSRVLPPTLFLQYQFMPKSKIRPYAGVGLNFTLFFDEELSSAAKTVLGASDLELENSFGLAAQAGVDYELGDGWSLNADVKYIQIDTKAEFTTALGEASVDVDINPLVFGLGVGKTF